MRRLIPLAILLALPACRDYDRYHYVASEKGLMPADSFAKYGTDQAISMAIGREFAKAHSGDTPADFAKQADAAVAYAKKFSQVTTIKADTLGYRLVVTFNDGWTNQITPVTDGKDPDQTVGLPKGS